MFFKKNKPEKPQESEKETPKAFGSSTNVSASFSMFAPCLNPAVAPIDFGFDRVPSAPPPSYVVPAPPPDAMSQPQPAQPDWNASPVPPTEDFFTQPPTQENWESAPQNVFPAPSFIDTPAPTWEEPVSSVPAMDFSGNASENTAYLGETFENYTTQAQSIEMDAAAAWQPPSEGVESPYNPSQFENPAQFESPAFMESMPELMPPAASFDPSPSIVGPEPLPDFSASFEAPPAYAPPEPLGNTIGDLMPWEQSAPNAENFAFSPSPETLWQNLDSGETLPGEQVPLSPGGMMDAMHQKLYPEDPFHSEHADLAEGQQAFEDAAQFLFPDTVSASLDWQEDTASPISYELPTEFQLPDEAGFPISPVDLGPSIQSDPSSFSDITSFYPEESRPVAPEPITSPLPADDQFAFSLEEEVGAFSLDEEAGFTPAFELPPAEITESGFLAANAFEFPAPSYEITPETTSWEPVESVEAIPDFNLASPEAMFEIPPPVYFPETTLPAPVIDEKFSLEPMPDDGFGDAAMQWQPPQQPLSSENESMIGQPAWVMPEEAETATESLEYTPTDNWFETESAFEESTLNEPSPNPIVGEFESLSSVSPVYIEQAAMPQLLTDQDFYATDFTLNEFGELIPASDAIGPIALPEAPLPVQEQPSWMPEPAQPTNVELAVTPDYFAPPISEAISEFQIPAPLEEISQMYLTESEPDLFSEDWLIESPAQPLEIIPQAPLPIEDKEPIFSFEEPLTDFAQADAAISSLPSDFLPPVSASPFAQIPLPPIPPVRSPEANVIPYSQPLPTQQAKPQHSPDSLEGQWQSTPVTDAPKANQSSAVKPSAGFSLGNVDVLGVCPLAEDRRLLVVNSDGVFALMGQVGLEQPQITVLKIFENNPLAYQNTFTAVAEAQAAAQGMFVTQVGTWHAIVSTYQDKITLHTELG